MEENNKFETNETQSMPQVSLEKPAAEKNEQPDQMMQGAPQNFNGQPMQGAPQNFGGQPMQGAPQNFGGQPMQGAPQNFNGQPMQGAPQNFGGQPMQGAPQNFGGQPMQGAPQNFGGQPMSEAPMGYQQQSGFEPGYIPGQNPGTQGKNGKKSKAGLVIGVIAVVAVVLIIIIGILLSRSFLGGGASGKVAKGFANMAKEMEEYTCSISDELGSDEIAERAKKEQRHEEGDVSITITDEFENLKLSFDAEIDHKNQQAAFDIDAGAMGFSIDAGTVVADGNTIYVSSPVFLREDTYAICTEDLGKNFNNSAWAELMGTELEDDYSLELFKDSDNDVNAELAEKITDSVKKYNKTLMKSVQYQTLSEKKDFEIGGNSVSCDGVAMLIEQDAYNDMMSQIQEDILNSDEYEAFANGYVSTSSDAAEAKRELDDMVEAIFSMRLEQDLEIDFYFDSKNRIVGISTPGSVNVTADGEKGAFEIDLMFTGVERALDEISGGIYVSSGDDIVFLGVTRNASVDKEQYSEYLQVSYEESGSGKYMDFIYSNIWNYDDKSFDMSITASWDTDDAILEMEGYYSDINKGESYTLNVNNITLSDRSEEPFLIASFVYSTEPSDEKIEVPNDAIDVFDMTESEIYTMMGNITSPELY